MCIYDDNRKKLVCTKHQFKVINQVDIIQDWCTLEDGDPKSMQQIINEIRVEVGLQPL